MPTIEKLHATGDFTMKSVIIYEDLAFLANAIAKLQRVGCRPKVNARWTIKSWPINTLEQEAPAERSLIEAADAHLIVIPARYARTLPLGLREWLERWATLRQIQDAAVAVIGDATHADFPRTVSPELAILVQKQGLNFIIDEVPVARNATKLVVRFPHERDLPLPPERPRFKHAVTSDSFRGFGINE